MLTPDEVVDIDRINVNYRKEISPKTYICPDVSDPRHFYFQIFAVQKGRNVLKRNILNISIFYFYRNPDYSARGLKTYYGFRFSSVYHSGLNQCLCY